MAKPAGLFNLLSFDNGMAVSWICVFIICSTLFAKWLRHRSDVAPIKKFASPLGNFFLGNLGSAIRIYSKKSELPSSVHLMQSMTGQCILRKEGIYAFWLISTPVLSVYNAKIMEILLSSSTSLSKSYEYSFLHPWLGLGLLTSTGPKWKSRRKILTPAFHFRILENFLPVFNDQSMVLVKKLHLLLDQYCPSLCPLIVLCTLDIVSESVMGVHVGAQNNSDSEYVKAVHNMGDYFNQRIIYPWNWFDFLFALTSGGKKFNKDIDILHSFTRKVIKERKQVLLQKPKEELSNMKEENAEEEDFSLKLKKRKAFLDLLLDMHINLQLLSEEDIREEVDTFMFEGHDTTAMGISWALYCIGLYPKVQKTIAEELDNIFGSDKERYISMDDFKEMKYLECTLKESQRLFPSVPMIGRKVDEDIIIGDKIIPKNTNIHCFLYMLHRDPEEFPNPEVFDPTRFLPENVLGRHPFAYVPFSAGPRNCIGQKFAMMEEKTVISNILRHFEVVSLDPRDKVHLKMEFVLRPAQPLRMKFVPRK